MNMKKMKRFVALALSVVMVLAMSVMAFAADETTYSLTINNSKTGHTYEAYQIFVGDLTIEENTKKLTNIKWGSGVSEAGQTQFGKADKKAETLNNANDAKTFAKEVASYLTTPTGSQTKTEQAYIISGLKPGYYLVKDKDSSLTGQENDVYTSYIMEVVGDTTATPKGNVPSFEKKIKDINDTTGNTTGWQDSADYDIGDDIPFKLEGTVASNYDDYSKYYFAFHDVEETGLTFNSDSVEVFVDGNKITSGFKVITSTSDGCTFEVVFDDLKNLNGEDGKPLVQAGTKIRVEYTSRLNKNAVLGNQGNVNKAKLEFSNNPNSNQVGKPGGTGETPWDNVIVFTYKVVVNKVDQNNHALSGAEFTLSKKLSNGSKDIAVVKNTEGTQFIFSGLDDGDYVLTETKTPSGYNSIDPITFTVNADHTITWEAKDRTTILTKLEGGNTFTGKVNTGELTAKIVNKAGSTLPSTGGIGTTIFYIVGGILMVGAAVLLITKRRAEN